MDYPSTAIERAKRRSDYLETHTMEGVRKGLKVGLSIRCANGDHGCTNSGAGCLCICHDPKE